MGDFAGIVQQRPDMAQLFGHSYIAGAVGTVDQTGRFDNLLLSALGTDYTNRRNHALSGSVLVLEGRRQGGWGRVFHEFQPLRGAPFTASGGMKLLCYGINDMGVLGDTGPITQMRACYVHAMRAVVSRCRASSVWVPEAATTLTYGAGFTSQASGEFSGTTFRQATTTTSATITITIPAGYTGEPIAICFLGMQGPGGTVTFSGTAGVTGTLSTGNVMPSATLSRVPMVKRVTGLTAAAAGQTIIATATAFDASGFIWFDSWWVESWSPPVVLVAEINRLTTPGYAFYSNWTGTEAKKDLDVLDWNAAVAAMLGEFDSAVEIIPLDGVVGKDALKTSDGIHLNEFGAGLAVDAMLLAMGRVKPPSVERGQTATLNVPSDRIGSRVIPRAPQHWYTPGSVSATATGAAVVGDMWATPFEVTQASSRWINFCVNAVTAAATGTSIRWGIYNDTNYKGYPKFLEFEATSTTVFPISIGAGVKVNPSNPTAGSFIWIPEPGIYHLAFKFSVVGATPPTFQTLNPADHNPLMPSLQTTGAPIGSGAHPTSWKLTGQGAGAFPNQFPAGAALVGAGTPAIGIKLN